MGELLRRPRVAVVARLAPFLPAPLLPVELSLTWMTSASTRLCIASPVYRSCWRLACLRLEGTLLPSRAAAQHLAPPWRGHASRSTETREQLRRRFSKRPAAPLHLAPVAWRVASHCPARLTPLEPRCRVAQVSDPSREPPPSTPGARCDTRGTCLRSEAVPLAARAAFLPLHLPLLAALLAPRRLC